jgi:Phage integrase, N-terminal SAM-like domain
MAARMGKRRGGFSSTIRASRKAKSVGPGLEGRKAIMLLAEKLSSNIGLDDFDIHEEPRMPLAQYAEGWMGGDVERNLRVTTAAKYREVMRKHWIPALGHVALRDLTRQGIRASVQRFQQQGLQNSSIRWFLNVLQSCLAAAVEDGQLDDNPAANSTGTVPSVRQRAARA